MSTTCKYCNQPEDKQNHAGLICETCICFVHITCLKSQATPGHLSGDVFFDFICEHCSLNGEETFERNRIHWVHVVLLSLYHMTKVRSGMSHHGYFHYKTHISSFINRHWNILFERNFKQKKNWVGTITGSLSFYSSTFFQSGSAELREAGWWRLRHKFTPAVAAYIIQEFSRDKPKTQKSRYSLWTEKDNFYRKVMELGYGELLNVEEDPVSTIAPVPAKKRKIELTSPDVMPLKGQNTKYLFKDSPMEGMSIEEEIEEDSPEIDSLFGNSEFPITPHVPQSDSSSVQSYRQSTHYDSDSSHNPTEPSDEDKTKKLKKQDDKPYTRRENLFSTQPNSVDMPWLAPPPDNLENLVPLTEYEEVQLLKSMEGLIPKVKDAEKRTYLSRFRAKLALRRLKRHKHLPVFDIDKCVKLLGGYATEETSNVLNVVRVLDRFQRSYLIDNLSGTIASTNYGTLLLSSIESTPFRSAYSGATLKPYIRRDYESTPTWLKLMDELLTKTNKNKAEPVSAPEPRASLDFSYVRAHHIAPLNRLCAAHFWPGIDLTESLQYPEFSCVVTYKKLVVGCAFLVPDVGTNEAYISFVLTRPEWRRAGIATFMLYHLLQTCTGQDVTLHVSPTNPAIFLYQKFGFKVEELVQDFYEKYYDIEYKGCRHALFLRLVR